MVEPIDMPLKKKYKSTMGVIKNGTYKPRTGNSHSKKAGIKRTPRVPKSQQS